MVIFIHGMGNDPNIKYWERWAANLLPHLIDLGMDPGAIDFGGVYYYDLVPQPGDGWKKISSLFYRDVLRKMREDLRQRRIREELLELVGRGPVDGLVNLVVDSFGDIFSYLLDDKTYEQVNQRLYRTVEQTTQPVTLVAYSLGSMVAFCALQQNPQLDKQVNHFITMGSPIFWFRRWLARRANLSRKPSSAHWTNLAGRLDVACPHLVGYTCQPDTHVEFLLDQYNPVKGHLSYISNVNGLKALAGAVAGVQK